MATRTKKRKSLAGFKKLSSLLALALRDVAKQERTKGCVVDMGVWWSPKGDGYWLPGKCVACCAGAVMRWSLRKPRGHSYIEPEAFDEATEDRLRSLDYLRCGDVSAAANRMRISVATPNRIVAHYRDDCDGWWRDMRKLLADLKANGD